MATIKEIREVPLDDLVIGKGQVRVKDVQRDIELLADSIRVQGLLQPIVVCESQEKGKYEILSGQRRSLAHKHLKLKTIRAAILADKISDSEAKAISLTENLVRRDVSKRELIDACTALYKKYGSVKAVCEASGLPARDVIVYVKYDRLNPRLKEMVDAGEIDIKVAIRVQDAASESTEDQKEIAALAKEFGSMTAAQQKQVIRQRRTKDKRPVRELIKSAKNVSKVTQIIVTISSDLHRTLQALAKSKGKTQDEIASGFIEKGLSNGKGVLITNDRKGQNGASNRQARI